MLSTLLWNFKALAVFNICLCFLSTTLFCWGVYIRLLWWITPCDNKNSFHCLLKNSFPLSVLNTLTKASNWILTMQKNYFKKMIVSFLNCIKKIQVALEKSSTTVRKYCFLSWLAFLYGPHTSMCTSSNGLVFLFPLSGKLSLVDITLILHITIYFILQEGNMLHYRNRSMA